MTKARRYSIEVKDAKTNALVLSTAVDWTNDEKQLALGQMFRLPGIAAAIRTTGIAKPNPFEPLPPRVPSLSTHLRKGRREKRVAT
jgi:hypothetical protein